MSDRVLDQVIDSKDALPGRAHGLSIHEPHAVFNTDLHGPFPSETSEIILGLGCFWGAEKVFWNLSGVYATMVGYAGGYTENPTYEEVCSGSTGHTEVVRIIFFPEQLSYSSLLAIFWEAHNPTQGMRQGNDRGSQYRSVVIARDLQQFELSKASKQTYQKNINHALKSTSKQITTEILFDMNNKEKKLKFYYAEAYHQQYLAKNPNGYCGLGGLDICYQS